MKILIAGADGQLGRALRVKIQRHHLIALEGGSRRVR